MSADSRPESVLRRRMLQMAAMSPLAGLSTAALAQQFPTAKVNTTGLAVTDTEPGIQGDRVSGARKPATLETGHVLQVPLFVNVGDRIRVDTRSGEYVSRA